MSFLRYMTLYSFRHLNPDWQVNLIHDVHDESRRWSSGEEGDRDAHLRQDCWPLVEKLGINILSLKDVFDVNVVDPLMADQHRKDLLSWHILANRGGFVADMDILFIHPMPKDFSMCDVALTCFTDLPKAGYIPVTFMGGSGRNNPVFVDIFNRAVRRYDPKRYECLGTECVLYTDLVLMQRDYPEVTVFRMPDNVVYHWMTSMDFGAGLLQLVSGPLTPVPDNCIGFHWYGGAPYFRNLNATLTLESCGGWHTVLGTRIKSLVETYGWPA